ncbi:bifunctional phosphatase PAP2/diacylglycerol kinase family protein [Streptomyces echinatus]
MASLALASLTINTIGKRSVRRARPVLDPVPLVRQLKRQPITTSFPSGHAASAAAFATGVALESPAWGAVVAPVAFSVAASRVYTGVHFPSDVLAGAALGAGAAFLVRRLVPTRAQLRGPVRPRAEVPALPEGEGLVMVANQGSGTADRVRALQAALPKAEIVECPPEEVADALAKAASRARVLGVCGGDGTVNTAAELALRHDVPLAVLPGGTLNHFAYDLGVEDERDLARAIRHGEAVRVDAGRFVTADGSGLFLNTLSLGVYPELVRERERWSHRIGGWPAGVLGALRVLHADRHPLEVDLGGETAPAVAAVRRQWRLPPHGAVARPSYRSGGRTAGRAGGARQPPPALRLLAAAAAGPLTRSPAHAAVQVNRLRLTGLAPGTPLAYDGEGHVGVGRGTAGEAAGGPDRVPPAEHQRLTHGVRHITPDTSSVHIAKRISHHSAPARTVTRTAGVSPGTGPAVRREGAEPCRKHRRPPSTRTGTTSRCCVRTPGGPPPTPRPTCSVP